MGSPCYLHLSIVALNQECYYWRTRAEGLNPKISKQQGWPHKLFPRAYHWDHRRFLETVYEKQTLRFYHSQAGSAQCLAGIKHTYYSKTFRTQNPHTNQTGVKAILRCNNRTHQEQVMAKARLVVYKKGTQKATDTVLKGSSRNTTTTLWK